MPDPSPRALRILCVDDNELVADALGRRVLHDPGLEWLGLVSDGGVIHSSICELRPDVVLLDVDMPDVDTFSLVERLALDAPAVRVVMFSGHVDVEYINRALDCGAWGYLSKNEDGKVLIDCIKRAGLGEVVLSAEVEAVQKRAHTAPHRDPPSSFPPF
jgi:two-component system invasion response regulator UvrY